MALLLDLSVELLLKIIALLHNKQHNRNAYGHGAEAVRHILPLSTTCKYLNACCGHWIFPKYTLRLRCSFYAYSRPLTPLDTPPTHEHWNSDAVLARLQHLRRKASFVRELILVDMGELKDRERQEASEGPQIFPECIMPDLLAVLGVCQRVTSISVTGGDGTLPLPLWDWISKMSLKSLEITGKISPPPGAQVHPSLEKFEVEMYSPTMAFTDIVRPHTIELHCRRFTSEPIQAYKPSASDNPQLRNIVLQIFLPQKTPEPLFDFSKVPQATIEADFYLGVEYKMHIPGAWKKLKLRLPAIFAEDLGTFNVSRSHHQGATVFRPSQAVIENGWEPEEAVHLEGAAYDEREAEHMRAYYAMRMQQQFRH